MRILMADYKNGTGDVFTVRYRHPANDNRRLDRLAFDYVDEYKNRGYELIAIAEMETDETGFEVIRVINRVFAEQLSEVKNAIYRI